jgi:tetratricopeptide (TPR) repeat protein
MKPRTFAAAAVVMVVVGGAVRLHNALTYPPLHGYDGFGHFTYIWFVSKTWRVPLATSGWSFFHPPLYYFLMAGVWDAMAGAPPFFRLHVGSAVMGLLSLANAGVCYVIVRRRFPGQRLVHLVALGLMLFLPLHLYSSAFLGNEGLASVLCSVSLLALLAALARPTSTRGALLGLALGLALLTKFSAVAVAAGALAAVALKALHERRLGSGLLQLGVVTTILLLVCGWFYLRNVRLYGTPFELSRGTVMVRQVENVQPIARRSLAEYLAFDPVILRRPAWPRGISMAGDVYDDPTDRWLRESVWTGVYANTWFDGFNGWAVPPVTTSELSRRAGQLLLCLGLVPTVLVLVGIARAIGVLWRRGWDDTLVGLLLPFAFMIGLFVYGTLAVRTPAAVKATYLMPVTVVFGFWLAMGFGALQRWRPRWARLAAAEMAFLGCVSVLVFWHGLLFAPSSIAVQMPMRDAIESSLEGIVSYAGGDRATARRKFRAAAAEGSFLGYENLATLAFQDGRPREALHLLKRAVRLQPAQSFGTPADRRRFDRLTRAEHLNSLAVLSHASGHDGRALRAARAARRLDPTLPEVHYNLGMLALTSEVGADGAPDGSVLRRARARFLRTVALDPAFLAALGMAGVAQALEGDCRGAVRTLEAALHPARRPLRSYPVETGPGAPQFAAIGRHLRITEQSERWSPVARLQSCRAHMREAPDGA